MADENKSGLAAGLANAAAALSNTPLPYLLGAAVLIALPAAANRWDGHLRDAKGCYEVKEIAGRVFNVDSCSGKTVEILTSQPPTTSLAKSASESMASATTSALPVRPAASQ